MTQSTTRGQQSSSPFMIVVIHGRRSPPVLHLLLIVAATTLILMSSSWTAHTPLHLVAAADCPVGDKPIKTLCLTPHPEILSATTHAAHTITYYASLFPCIEWEYLFLTNNDNGDDVRQLEKNFVQTWVTDAGNCSFLVGPGFSSVAIAMSPLVEIPWFDPTSTSTELSNKVRHPSFSRVIPTDDIGAQAASVVYAKFGWKDTHLFAADESYGRSISQSFGNQIRAAGGAVGESFVIHPDATGANVDLVKTSLELILNSKIRTVFVAMLPFHGLFDVLKAEILRTKANEKLIFFFSEAMCSFAHRAYNEIPGAFCATYSLDPTIMNPFLASYKIRDKTAVKARLASLNFNVTDEDLESATDLYAALAHDAALHGMHSLHEYYIDSSWSALNTSIEVARLIITENGASGNIELSTDGDRNILDADFWHTVDNATTEVRMASLKLRTTGSTVHYLLGGDLENNGEVVSDSARPDMLIFGAIVTAADDIPASTLSDPVATASNITLLIGTILGAAVILALSCIFMSAILRPKHEGRDTTHAPTDADRPFTIVFTDIQSSTSLWAREPQIMSEAVELHHRYIRKIIGKHKGYEVKTLGDSFMVAFRSSRAAARFAIDIQVKLKELNWEDDGILEDCYQEFFIEEGRDIAPQTGNLWQGLRVRIGIHEGFGQIKYDEVTNGYDYFGTAVNTAARLESVGHGGQIIVEQETLRGICEDSDTAEERWATPMPSINTGRAIEMDGFFVFPLGSHVLRGLETSSTLYQLSPKGSLLSRKWPPLRMEASSIQTYFEHEDPFTPMVSVSSSVGPDFKLPPEELNGMLYKHCKKRLMRWHEGWSMERIEASADRLMETQLLLKTLLSTGKDKFRRSTVTTLAQKWNLVYTVTESRLTAPRTYETALMDLAIKVQNVVDNHCKRERNKIVGATEVDPSIPPKSTWVTRRGSLGSFASTPQESERFSELGGSQTKLSRGASAAHNDGTSLRSAMTPDIQEDVYLDENALAQIGTAAHPVALRSYTGPLDPLPGVSKPPREDMKLPSGSVHVLSSIS